MVTRTHVDRLPVPHRAKRVSKVTLATPFAYPEQNPGFIYGTADPDWVAHNSATKEAATNIGNVANVLKITHTSGNAGLRKTYCIFPGLIYNAKIGVYVPSGQTWSTSPRLRISSNSGKFVNWKVPTALTVEDAWNWYDFDFTNAHYLWIDVNVYSQQSGSGNFFYVAMPADGKVLRELEDMA